MAVSPSLALYTWYHQHKTKDLGVGQKDWLQYLKKQAKQDAEQSNCTKTSPKTETCKRSVNADYISRELLVRENTNGDSEKLAKQQNENSADSASSHHSGKIQHSPGQKNETGEDWDQSSNHSQGMDRAQLHTKEAPATPLSAFLHTPLNSPALLLPHGNNTSLEERDNSSLYSPTLPLCDAFSPAKKEESPRDTIMESLAGNLDGSEVSWSSALATPTTARHGHILGSASPSTLERQTLHPRQRLRENVMARTLFSPRTSGATSSSSGAELSPGLGIIKCFSPVPRFSCRSVLSADVKKPCPGESSKPGWLEGGTQGFRVNSISEQKVNQGKKVVVTPEENQQGNRIKPIFGNGEYSPSHQINLSQDCAVVGPEQTSTPTQPKAVRARHLSLTAQSSDSPGFIEPIPLPQEIKEDKVQEVDSASDKRAVNKLDENVMDVTGCEGEGSDFSEYSYGSAGDPFDIICSPVSKKKRKKKSGSCKSKLTLGKSDFQSAKIIVPSNPIGQADAKIMDEPVPGESLNSHSEQPSGDCPKEKLHAVTDDSVCNKSIEKSVCEDVSALNGGKNQTEEDIDLEVESFNEENSAEMIACWTVTEHQSERSAKKSNTSGITSLTGKHVAALFTKAKNIDFPERACKDKERLEKTYFGDTKDIVPGSLSEQQQKCPDVLSLYTKRRPAKSFIYPADLGEQSEELNVSWPHTGRCDERGNKAVTPGNRRATFSTPVNKLLLRHSEAAGPFNKEATFSTPTNRMRGNEGHSEAEGPFSKGATYSTPTNRMRGNEGHSEAAGPFSKGATYSTPTNRMRVNEGHSEAAGPFSKRATYSTPTNRMRGNKGHREAAGPFSKSATYSTPTNRMRGNEGHSEAAELFSKSATYSTPTNRMKGSEGLSEAARPYSKGATYGTPTNRMRGSEGLSEAAGSFSKGATYSTPTNRMRGNERWVMAAVPPDSKRTGHTPTIPSKRKEELHIVALKQESLPLTSLGNKDTSERNSMPSLEPIEHARYGQKATSLEFQEVPAEKKENEGSDYTLRVVPVASVVPYEREWAGELGNQEAQYKIELPESNVPHINGAEDLTTEVTEGQRKSGVSSLLNHQVVSDTFSDIDFSDSDLDISIPVGDNSTTGNDKGIKSDKESNNIPNTAHNKENFDGNHFNTSEISSGFKGFMTGSGKQIKVSEKALFQARKILEEQLCEEQSLAQQQVPPGESVTIDYSSKFNAEREKNKLTDLLVTSNSNQCTVSEKGSLNLASGLLAPSNGEASEVVKQLCKNIKYSVPKVNNSSEELVQDESLKEISDGNLNTINDRATSDSINHGDLEASTRAAVQATSAQVIEVDKVDCNKQNEQIMSTKTLETENCSHNQGDSLDQENCGVRNLSENVLQFTLRDKAKWTMTNVTENYPSGSLSRVSSEQITSKMLSEQSSFMESFCKGIPTSKSNSALEMDVRFHTAKGEEVSVKEASIAQAHLLWKKTASSEVTVPGLPDPQQQQTTSSNHDRSEEVSVGFHTAKGKKVSVNEASVARAHLLWKETGSCEVTAPDQEGPQEQQNIFTTLNAGSSFDSGGNFIQSEILIKPRRLFEDGMHSHTADIQQCASFKAKQWDNLPEAANQKMQVGHQTESYNVYESMDHKENTLHEAKNAAPKSEFCVFLTGNKKQVKVSSESLQKAKQLLQECTSSEGSPRQFIEPSCEIVKDSSNAEKRQSTTVEALISDENSGNADETHGATCRSPIFGSQKRRKPGKITSSVTAHQKLLTNSVNTQEISDISDITEAFLKDHIMDSEETTEACSSQRKRFRGPCQDGEENSLISHKRLRRNVVVNQLETSQVCDESEAARTLARKKQERLVHHKDKQTVQPVPGSLYKLRTERRLERITLHSLGSLKVYKKSRNEALGISFSSALQYRFEVQDSRCDSMECGDGCVVVPGPDGCVGVEEVELGFLAVPSVHPGLLPSLWVPNHYKLIVWQLAALERRLLDCNQVLTVKNVIARLKYRYDREIDRAERSILRKVTEQDDIPQKTMVLCVTKIVQEDDAGEAVRSHSVDSRLLPLMELTDGWYKIGAVVDRAMAQLIEDRKVKVGTKLVLHGAELVGAAFPCHPLQAPSTLRLRLHTNMTRRARWWARLGLLPQRGPIPSLIENTHNDGGVVGQVKVMVARLYTLYYERLEGSVGLFMGEKAHLKKLRETEKERELLVDQITAEVEKELNQQEKEEGVKRERRTMTHEEIRGLTLGQEISYLLDEAADPSNLEGLLSLHQLKLARLWRERHAEEVRREVHNEVKLRLSERQKPYEAIPLLKVRIVDGKSAGALVTVWKSSVELRETLSEGSFFTIRYLMAAGCRWGSRQFISTRQTRWEQSFRGPALWQVEFARSLTPFCLTNSGELNPLWQEVDVAGVVLRVGKPNSKFQTVHLVDHHLNIVAVKFWGGLKMCGYEDSVVVGAVVCLMNCSWRGHSGASIACIHFTELSVATCSPSSPHLVEAAAHLRQSIKDVQNLLNEADKILDAQLDSQAFPDKGLHSGEKTPECRHGGRMEGGPPQADENIVSTSKVNRQQQQAREVQNKLRALSQYGSPGCPPGILSPASLQAHKAFRIPLRKPQSRTTNEVEEKE